MSQRINYDEIAELYDRDRLREKEADPAFLALVDQYQAQRADPWLVLDIGCGTGSQLVANQAQSTGTHLVGLDLHQGMLRQAKQKTEGIDWLQADGARLPFRTGVFDLITNQFAFHHVQDKPAMMAEVFRTLRPEGQFVMTNISPRRATNWIIYRYFPSAFEIDLQDFLPLAEIKTLMIEVGFKEVVIAPTAWQYEEDLHEFADVVRHRVVSQLRAISERDYQAGLQQIAAELQQAKGQPISIPSEVCLVKITGDKAA